MGARELLDDLTRAGLTVMVEADRLIVKPASKLTDDLRAAVRDAKPDLLTLVSAGSHALTPDEANLAHAERWDDAACSRFVARASHLMRIGIHPTDADDLAERLHLRDVTGDDRRMCVECRHHRRTGANPCANGVAAGERLRIAGEATTLQRCRGFGLATANEASALSGEEEAL